MEKPTLQSLDAEHRRLWKSRAELDAEVTRLCGDDERNASWEASKRIRALRQEFDEAGARAEAIEQYAMTVRPTSELDAIMLLRIAKAVAQDNKQDRYIAIERDQLLPRMIAEVANFLINRSDPNDDAVIRGLSLGADCRPWSTGNASTGAAPEDDDKATIPIAA